ncbi:DUF4391 domain-containing protein [Treponema sp. HNW]|uniref:DUF4391 domain-containing protein n=1 Tax=Treponema sp. HNW TaxID=3116654 RepID=UPI003D115A6D
MFGLPKSTEVSKLLAKSKLYTKFNMSNSVKSIFDENIAKIIISHEISSRTLSIVEGEKVRGIYVLHIFLKRKEFKNQVLVHLINLIKKKIIIALQYQDEVKFAVYCTRLIQSEWLSEQNAQIPLVGLNLGRIWENIVMDIACITSQDGIPLDERIKMEDERIKIEKEISRLSKKARKENQPNKKYTLVQQIRILKKELQAYEE